VQLIENGSPSSLNSFPFLTFRVAWTSPQGRIQVKDPIQDPKPLSHQAKAHAFSWKNPKRPGMLLP
jgi:hypothetical protein